MTIPIIVLNWNNADDTIECVKSALAQSWPDKNILVGDNGSDVADYNEVARELSDNKSVRIIRFNENLGFTKAHNILITEALKGSPEFIALLNNDAFAEKDWLTNLVKCSRETGAEMVTSKMISYHDHSVMDNAGHFMLNTGEIIPLGFGEPAADYTTRFYNLGPCAGACLYSSEMLNRTGLFDEFFETGYEDAELGLRAIATGSISIFEPEAVVRHKMGVSVNKVMNIDYLKKIQLNIFYTYIKILPAGYILLNIPFIIFRFFAIVLIDIIFLRVRFLKMILISHYEFIVKVSGTAFRSRRKVRNNQLPKRPTCFFVKKTMFFLGFDIKRFLKYIILGNKTQYEKLCK